MGMALRGGNLAEVDGLLRAAGQHRPPEGFGVAPFPAFDAIERSAEDEARAGQQRAYLESVAADPRAAAAHTSAVVVLRDEGDDDGDAPRQLDLEAKFRRAFAEDGLAEDGTPLDADSCDDLGSEDGW